MARRWEGEVRFLGVAWRDSEDAMQAFVKGYGLEGFPHVDDQDESFFRRFGVPYQPGWAFVAPDGEAVSVLGALPEADLESILADLAGGKLPSS